MEISLIAALTRDRIIGSQSGGIPWDLPRDKAHFRAYTAEKPILVGRRTFDEMRGWFTTQSPIFVLTRNPNFSPHTPARIVSSVREAIAHSESQSLPELVVAGGASAFEAALPVATKLVLTWIECAEAVCADGSTPVRFPDIKPARWRITHTEHWPADAQNPLPMTLEISVPER